MIKHILRLVLAAVLLLAVAVAVNTLRQGSRQLEVAAAPPLAVDTQAVADKLAGAIRFQTVSSLEDADRNAEEFRKLHAYLEQRFPLVALLATTDGGSLAVGSNGITRFSPSALRQAGR